jgi:hypothetical protein
MYYTSIHYSFLHLPIVFHVSTNMETMQAQLVGNLVWSHLRVMNLHRLPVPLKVQVSATERSHHVNLRPKPWCLLLTTTLRKVLGWFKSLDTLSVQGVMLAYTLEVHGA